LPKLYGCYRSRATRNFWLAGETGMDLTLVPVVQAYRLKDPDAPDAPRHTRSPDFLAISPAGAIPVLQDGDLVLSESLAINLYLAKKHGGPLAPADAAEDALMVQWALYGMTAIEPHTLPIMYAYAEGRAGTDAGKAEIATHAAALERPLKALDTHLAGHGGQMVGGRFTVADINMAEVLRYAQPHPTLIAGYPAVQRWLAACQARAAFKEMMARREAEPANP
jgi:glutathione S-transferase